MDDDSRFYSNVESFKDCKRAIELYKKYEEKLNTNNGI